MMSFITCFILIFCSCLYGVGYAQITDSITDARDGQVYTVVKIGTQWWMAENLNVGTWIHVDSGFSDNGIIEKYAYNNDTSNLKLYGGMYNWNEAMAYDTADGAQGICPNDWHLPSDEDWKTLERELGMTQSQADSTGWRGTDQGNQLKPDSSAGFNVQYAGLQTGAMFLEAGNASYMWSSTIDSSGIRAYSRFVHKSIPTVYRNSGTVNGGFCIRCVADSGVDVPVDMGSFDAEQSDEGVRITWTTVSEQENLGFNLHRSSTPDGGFEKINPRLIPGAGTTTIPQEYAFTDVNVSPGTWWYVLEQVDNNGHKEYFYPVPVQYGTASLDDGGKTSQLQNGSSRLMDLQGSSVAADGIGIRFIRDEYSLKKVLKLD